MFPTTQTLNTQNTAQINSTTKQIVREHLASAQGVMDKIKTKQQAKDFLIRAGIVDKSGAGLAPPYR